MATTTDTTSAIDTSERARPGTVRNVSRRNHDETKPSFLTTEFYAMVGVIAALLIAAKVSDSFGDVRAWTLVSAVAIGYMISRGLAKSGSVHQTDNDDTR
jgi:hypothetical protein